MLGPSIHKIHIGRHRTDQLPNLATVTLTAMLTVSKEYNFANRARQFRSRFFFFLFLNYPSFVLSGMFFFFLKDFQNNIRRKSDGILYLEAQPGLARLGFLVRASLSVWPLRQAPMMDLRNLSP